MKREGYTKALPGGYKKLNYIESTGTQYIDTGLVPYTGLTASARFSPVYDEQLYTPLFFSGLEYNSTDNFGISVNYNATTGIIRIIGYMGGTDNIVITQNSEVAFGDRLVLNLEYGYAEVNDIDKDLLYTAYFQKHEIENATRSIYIFHGNTTNKDLVKYSNTRLYGVSFGNNMDLVPALRLSDNKPGLYDLCGSICPLTNTPFYINEGTGEFLYE